MEVGFIYDIAYNLSFNQKLESVQYNVALVITGTIRGTSREKLYYKIDLKFLKSRRWYRKLACFYKVFKTSLSIVEFLLHGRKLLDIPSNTNILITTTDFFGQNQRI